MSVIKHNIIPKFLILVRGIPGAGKSTIISNLKSKNITIIDPDYIDFSSINFRNFKVVNTKNPTENVKIYSYLFWKSFDLISKGKNVIWAQPWSRRAEVELTIRNLNYYFTNLGEKVWKLDIQELINTLPFFLGIVNINITPNTARKRFIERQKNVSEVDLKRLEKTITMFENISYFDHTLNIDSSKKIVTTRRQLDKFIENIKTPQNKSLSPGL